MKKALCLLLFVLIICSLFGCKKVTPAQPVFKPYYTSHTPSAFEQGDAKLLSGGEVPEQNGDSEIVPPHFCYSIYTPDLALPSVDAQVSDYVQEQIAAAQAFYQEDAGLNLDYSLNIFADLLGELKFCGFSCPLTSQQPGEHMIYKAFFYNAQSGQVYTLEDMFLPGQMQTLYSVIDDAFYHQARLIISSDSLSDDFLLYAMSFEQEALSLSFAAGTLGQSQMEDLTITIPYEDISSCIGEPLYDLLADYLPARGRKLDPNKPMVALTFDDGPSRYTIPIAELAEQYGGRVTFCVVGNRLSEFSDSVIRVSEAGHEIANHTWEHKNLTSISYGEIESQITRTSDKVRELTGKPTKFIRPTYGSVNDTLRQFSRDAQMPLANWAVDTLDWKSRDADAVYNECMSVVKDGDIVLFHDLYESTYHAVQRIIPELAAQGYQFVTLSELIEYSGKDMEYGKIYFSTK